MPQCPDCSYPLRDDGCCPFCGRVPLDLNLRLPRPKCCGYVTSDGAFFVCESCGRAVGEVDLVADIFGRDDVMDGSHYLPLSTPSRHSRDDYFADVVQRYQGFTERLAPYPRYVLDHLRRMRLDLDSPDLPTVVCAELSRFPRHQKLYREVFGIIRGIGGGRNRLEPWQAHVLDDQFRAINGTFREIQTSGSYGGRKSFLNYWMCLDAMLDMHGWQDRYRVPLMRGEKQRARFRAMFAKITNAKIHTPWSASDACSRT